MWGRVAGKKPLPTKPPSSSRDGLNSHSQVRLRNMSELGLRREVDGQGRDLDVPPKFDF